MIRGSLIRFAASPAAMQQAPATTTAAKSYSSGAGAIKLTGSAAERLGRYLRRQRIEQMTDFVGCEPCSVLEV